MSIYVLTLAPGLCLPGNSANVLHRVVDACGKEILPERLAILLATAILECNEDMLHDIDDKGLTPAIYALQCHNAPNLQKILTHIHEIRIYTTNS